MCCVLEVLSVVFGIMTLVRGRFSLNKNKEVRGPWAYVIGVVLLATIPVAVVAAVILNFDALFQPGGPQPFQLGKLDWRTMLPDAIGVVGCWGTALLIAAIKGEPKIDERRRLGDDEYDDYDDDRPRRRSRYDDDDDVPRRRRADAYDDDDDRPRRRRYEDDDDEDDRPRRRDDLDDRAR
jgi:hypothetical protein